MSGPSCHSGGVQVGCRIRLADGEVRHLTVGEVIGRSWNAALRLPDPRISEAHALVSLRGSVLKLLALRGRFAIAGKPLQEVDLTPGLIVWLTSDLSFEVLSVILPAEVLAIEGDGLARHVLHGVSALHIDPRPRLVPGYASNCAALVWHDGLVWLLRIEGEDRPLVAGDEWTLGADGDGQAHTFRAVSVEVEHAGYNATVGLGGIDRPLHIVLRYDSAHIHREGEPVVPVTGVGARILSELGAMRGPVSWSVVAREIWPDEVGPTAQRRRWDVSVNRLRERLRSAGIRTDLVRADGGGNVELFLHQSDRVDDET